MPGVFSSQSVRDFHSDVTSGFLERSQLRLWTLRVQDRAVAALYCLKQCSETVYYLGGFTPDYAQYNPLKVLIAHAIRHSIEEGVQVFDFIKGEEDYKARWRAEGRMTHRVLLAPRRFKGWFTLKGLGLQPTAKEWIRKLRALKEGWAPRGLRH